MIRLKLIGAPQRGKARFNEQVELAMENAVTCLLRRRLNAKQLYGPVTVRYPDGSREMVC